MKKLRRRQNLWNKLRRRQDFFDWILMCTRFIWLNPGSIAFHWENGEIRCGLWGITQKKVWAAGSPLSERWNKVRAFDQSLRRRCGLQAAHWASVDSDHLHCMSCGMSYLYMDGGTGSGGGSSSCRNWIWGPLDLFWHFIKNTAKDSSVVQGREGFTRTSRKRAWIPTSSLSAAWSVGKIMIMFSVAKIGTRTWTWVMMICRPTHALFLVLSLSFFLSLWHTCSPSFSLFFPLSLFSWYLLIKIEFLDISWFKTLFLWMFGKVYIYSNTHPLTWSQVYPPSHKYHINTPFLRVKYQVKTTPKSHANTLRRAMTLSLHYTKKLSMTALRDFHIEMTVQTLFTTISSKTCIEHVHTVPCMVCLELSKNWRSHIQSDPSLAKPWRTWRGCLYKF